MTDRLLNTTSAVRHSCDIAHLVTGQAGLGEEFLQGDSGASCFCTVNSPYVEELGQGPQFDGASGGQVMLIDDGVYEEEILRGIYSSQYESSGRDEAICVGGIKEGGIESSLLSPIPVQTPEPELPDPRSLQKADLSSLINTNENLDKPQQVKLIELLNKYRSGFSTKPGKCNVFEYKFQVSAIAV
jgi:hypothetical protein